MTLFDLLFLGLALAAVAALSTAAFMAARGETRRSLRIALRVAIGAGVYGGVVVLVALASSRRVYRIGEAQCYDDWCMTVTGAARHVTAAGVSFDVTLKLTSRALRVTQRERGAVVYMTDALDRRFDPEPDSGGVPLDVALEPGQAIVASRTFDLPAGTADPGLVLDHTGFPIGLFVIGENYWFHHRPVVRIG